MTPEAIVELVLKMEPSVRRKIQPGFDFTRFYVEKAVELTTKIVLKEMGYFVKEKNENNKNYWK